MPGFRAARLFLAAFAVAVLAPSASSAEAGCEAPALLLPKGVWILDPGGRRNLDVFVENGNPSGVTVQLNVTSPKGWRAILDGDRVALGGRTPSAGNATIRKLSILAPERGAGVAIGEVIVTGRAECLSPTGAVSPPAAASVAVRLAEPPAPGLFLGMAAVLAGAVFVAVWRVRRTRPLIKLEAPDATRTVAPGRSVSFPLRLENVRSRPDTIALRLEGIPLGWTAFVPLPEVEIEPGETKDLWLLVRPPPYAEVGSAARIVVRALPRLAAPVPPVVVTATVAHADRGNP